MPSALLTKLIDRGDHLAIDEGVLIIKPRSGSEVPTTWLKENQEQLTHQVLVLMDQSGFRFHGFTRGSYGERREPGINLKFLDLLTFTDAYTNFNADIHRDRTTLGGDKGKLLPGKRFRVTEHHGFYKFWMRAGLSLPQRLSAFDRVMGKLRKVLFTADYHPTKPERIRQKTITPLNICYEDILERYFAEKQQHNQSSNSEQTYNNLLTTSVNKESAKSHIESSLQSIPNAGVKNYGKRLTGKKVICSINTEEKKPLSPQHQTMSEWLSEYESS